MAQVGRRPLVVGDQEVDLARCEAGRAPAGPLGQLGQAVPDGLVPPDEAVDVQGPKGTFGGVSGRGTSARIVTPEAVRLDFEPAGVGTRVLATLLDLVIQSNLLWVVVGLVGGAVAAGEDPGVGVAIVVAVGTFLAYVGYPVLCEVFWNGQTVGKMALGLRVRTREGTPVRFRHAAVRASLGLVELYATLGVPAVLSILLSRDHQRLGDLAAGTVVMRERTASAHTGRAYDFWPPQGWGPYTAGLDVGAVTDQQYGLVRNFLLRAHELTPAARTHLARRLAEPLARITNHTPPANVSAEQFLLCVAAAYQRRQDPGRLLA
jgi:uncharacterized RDD family membrane protein YckC